MFHGVCFLCDLEERRQNKIAKLSSDFNALNDSKALVSKQILLVEKERNKYKIDFEKADKELKLAWTTNSPQRFPNLRLRWKS